MDLRRVFHLALMKVGSKAGRMALRLCLADQMAVRKAAQKVALMAVRKAELMADPRVV